jgi:hypothetical protein
MRCCKSSPYGHNSRLKEKLPCCLPLPLWVKTPRTRRASAMSGVGGEADEIGTKTVIA